MRKIHSINGWKNVKKPVFVHLDTGYDKPEIRPNIRFSKRPKIRLNMELGLFQHRPETFFCWKTQLCAVVKSCISQKIVRFRFGKLLVTGTVILYPAVRISRISGKSCVWCILNQYLCWNQSLFNHGEHVWGLKSKHAAKKSCVLI